MFDNSDSEKSPRPTLPPHIITVMPPSPVLEEDHEQLVDEAKHEQYRPMVTKIKVDNDEEDHDLITVIKEEEVDQNHLALGTEFLSFREKAFYGLSENNTSQNTSKLATTRNTFHDIHMLAPCSCFSFLNIFNKQKRQ